MAGPVRSMVSLILLYKVIGKFPINLNYLARAGEEEEEGKLSRVFDPPKGPHLYPR